jgi:hypothetical protein
VSDEVTPFRMEVSAAEFRDLRQPSKAPDGQENERQHEIGQQDPERVTGIHLTPPLAPPDPATSDDLTERQRNSPMNSKVQGNR